MITAERLPTLDRLETGERLPTLDELKAAAALVYKSMPATPQYRSPPLERESGRRSG